MPNQYDPASPWRDEAKVALLKQMIAQGALRSEIARALGVTRSAVIGKAKRLGLSLAGSAGEEARAAAAKRWSATCRPKQRQRRVAGETAKPDRTLAPGAAAKRQPGDVGCSRLPTHDTQPGNTRVAAAEPPLMLSLLELEPHSCRWPFGDPDRPGFGFCGHAQAEGSSYCEAHRDISVGAAEAPDTQAAAA